MSGMHASSVYNLRQALKMDMPGTPVRVIEPYQMLGLMEADLTVSYEKLVVDDEILGMCGRVLRGIEVTDETMGLEMMLEKAPGEDFLGEMHTVKHMRGEFLEPTVANRDQREVYHPGDAAWARAHARVLEIQGAPPVHRIPGEVREKMLTRFPEIQMPE